MSKNPTSRTKKVGAGLVNTKVGPVWCHVSVQEDTLKFRRYLDGKVVQVDAETDDIETFVDLHHCKSMVSASSYSYRNVQAWSEILRLLESGVAQKEDAGKKPRPRIVVPITELRRVYDVMDLMDTATFENLARFYCEKPKSLERLWNLSRASFENYRNPAGWEESDRKELPKAPARPQLISKTDEFTAFILEHGLGEDHELMEYVTREMNPWSTRLGVFSNKLPATKSGRGGMDLLFRSRTTGNPVIGEVKVKRDKNAFYALVQAMTYAVELSTKNQLRRLKNNFKEFADLNIESATTEIVIIQVNRTPASDKTLKPVIALVEKLNKRSKCDGLSGITLLRNQGAHWHSHT